MTNDSLHAQVPWKSSEFITRLIENMTSVYLRCYVEINIDTKSRNKKIQIRNRLKPAKKLRS